MSSSIFGSLSSKTSSSQRTRFSNESVTTTASGTKKSKHHNDGSRSKFSTRQGNDIEVDDQSGDDSDDNVSSLEGGDSSDYSLDEGDIDATSFYRRREQRQKDKKSTKSRDGKRNRISSRLPTTKAELLEAVPPIPDLRFDHNYRLALDQVHAAYNKDCARYAVAQANKLSSTAGEPGSVSASTKVSKASSLSDYPPTTLQARIAVMTLRDVIILPFINGFFWGFGAVLLSLVQQRGLAYYISKWMGWDNVPARQGPRGPPARVQRFGSGPGALGIFATGRSQRG